MTLIRSSLVCLLLLRLVSVSNGTTNRPSSYAVARSMVHPFRSCFVPNFAVVDNESRGGRCSRKRRRVSGRCCSIQHKHRNNLPLRMKHFEHDLSDTNERIVAEENHLNVTTATNTTELITTNHGTPESNPTSPNPSKIPSYQQLSLFAATTVLIWLSEPLLSLIDTTVIGTFSSSPSTFSPITPTTTSPSSSSIVSPNLLQLTALGPATMLCDTSVYLTYFLAIATTNQLATATAQNDTLQQIRTTSQSLGLALCLGMFVTVLLCFTGMGRFLLECILGSNGALLNGIDRSPQVLHLALSYVRIRALVTPLIVAGTVAQSISLATLDTKSPIRAVCISTIVNILGDGWLVCGLGWGLTGAAVATALAGGLGSLVLLGETRKKVVVWKQQLSDSGVMDDSSSSGGGNGGAIMGGNGSNNGFVSLPDRKSLLSLCKLAGPIFFVMVGKVICYSATSVRASGFGMVSLAAHTIMLRIFYFFCTFGDCFSQVSQSFVPAVLYGRDGNGRDGEGGEGESSLDCADADVDVDGNGELVVGSSFNHSDGDQDEIMDNVDKAKDTPKNDENSSVSSLSSSSSSVRSPTGVQNKTKTQTLLKKIIVLASIMALINSFISKTIVQNGSSLFTNDVMIQSVLRKKQNVLYLAGCVLLHPFLMAFEGSILAARDLGYLLLSYGVTTVALLLFLWRWTTEFTDVWRSLFLFQMGRCVLFGWRMIHRVRDGDLGGRSEREMNGVPSG